MLTYVPFSAMSEKHLRAIAESLLTCPESERPTGQEMLDALRLGTARLFEFDDSSIVVLSRNERRLMVDCWAGVSSPYKLKCLAEDVRRVAADWECDTIETMVFDLRLAHAICRIGGRIESVCVTLPVAAREPEHG